MRIIIAAVGALLLFAVAVAAADMPMPRMLKGMQKGQWRMEMLENSMAKPGQQMPARTICTDNLMKHSAEKSAKSECKRRLVKDSADEAVMEMTCPDHTVTATMKRESAKAVLIDVKSAGKGGPHNMKMRYTSLGACREGQATMSYDKNSEQCKKMQSAAAKADPAKDCAGDAAQRAQCEQMIRQRVAQMKAMCN
jgi:hypothetical protein